MSNTDRRLPLAVAKQIAQDLVELLEPACEKIAVAGSIRRMKDDVGDVEVVCIPRHRATTAGTDMFGEPVGVQDVNMLDVLCRDLVEQGVLAYRLNVDGHRAWGSELKWGIFQGFNVDIYSATPETWAVTLAIRTGPADFSRRMVTDRRAGGMCPHHLHFKGWRLRRRDTGEALETPDEQALFRALGLEWLEPVRRTDTTRPRWLQEAARG